MPNWCYQVLTIAGPKEDRDSLISSVRFDVEGEEQQMFSLRSLVPLDERAYKQVTFTRADGTTGTIGAFAELKDDGFDGYSHACERWGTKWGDCDTELNLNDDNITEFTLSSAWSPIEKLIVNISVMYPRLCFCLAFTEESSAFAGHMIIKQGEIIEDVNVNPNAGSPEVDWDDDDSIDNYNEWRDSFNDEVYESAGRALLSYVERF